MAAEATVRFGLSKQLILLMATLVIISGVISTWLAYENSKTQLEEALGKELLSLVNSVSPFIRGSSHENIVRVDSDFVDGIDSFKEIRRQLLKVKKSNGLQVSSHGSPLYTLRKTIDFSDNNMLEFVVMTDPNDKGQFFIGNTLPVEPHHLIALDGQSATTGLYEDEEGVWISAVAPIFGKKNKVVGILQADRHVSFFYDQASMIAKELFMTIAIIIILAMAIATYYARRLTQPINMVVEAAQAFGKGDYKQTLTIQRNDEIGFLGATFNKMSLRIRESQAQQLKQKLVLQKLSKALAGANKGLEAKVAERTKQLQQNHSKLQSTLDSLQKSQATLVQSEKMASLGQLAAGVAHEINNPMAFITSNMSTLREYASSIMGVLDKVNPILDAANQDDRSLLEESIQAYREACDQEDLEFLSEDMSTLLDESIDGAVRVKDIVANLKGYSRVDSEELQTANINECLESTLKIAKNETKQKCEIVKEFGNLPDILCNPGKLNQVFTNLIVNAAQAIEEQGTVTIKTQVDANDLVVSISDTGKGIPKENLEKLFDAFFTTKPVGEGTGLGLYISYDIIKEHDGELIVDSEVGTGTTFTIKLPIERKQESQNAA